MEPGWLRTVDECVLWFDHQRTSRGIRPDLRSPELDPKLDPKVLFTETTYGPKHLPSVRAAVNRLIQARASRVGSIRPGISPAHPEVLSGRFLLYAVEGSDWCELAVDESDGLFDEADCPGWDSWISLFDPAGPNAYHILLCWIPPECLAAAEAGMSVMTTDPSRWAVDPDVAQLEIVRHLRDRDFLRRT